MTHPSGPDQNAPQYGAPQYGAPQYGAPPGFGPAPAYYGGQALASPTVGFGDAVRSALGQYAGFRGRARRSEYWWFVLFFVLVYLGAALIDGILFGFPLLVVGVLLGLFVPNLAVSVRRLHDTNRSGWWLLLNLVPFGGIVVLVFQCLDSDMGPNQYGPSPKYQPAGF